MHRWDAGVLARGDNEKVRRSTAKAGENESASYCHRIRHSAMTVRMREVYLILPHRERATDERVRKVV
jgi:hypothetical protein